MIRKAVAIFLGGALVACGTGGAVIPLLRDLKVKIGSPPVLLLHQVEPVPDGNAARQFRLIDLFAQAGCTNVERRWRRASDLPHVACILKGRTDRKILVSANFDEPIGRGYRDNWTGAAMLPSLYRSLRVEPREHTYEFVGFADEGVGSVGSPAASARMVVRLPADERSAIVALVSLQGLGLDLPAVWDKQADPNLNTDLYSVSRSLELPVRRVDFLHHHKDVFTLDQPIRLPRTLDIPSILIGVADTQAGEYLDSFRLVAVYLSYLDQTLALRKRLLEEGEQDTATARETSG